MGKLGSREMTAASDLDLMVIYDIPERGRRIRRPRPLGAALYYARFTQRLIAALTAPTKAGKLYDVDLRLRPSGRKGPLATQFRLFRCISATEAETWEHMALTRARVIAGDAGLAQEIAGARRDAAGEARTAQARARSAADARVNRAREGRERPLGSEAGQAAA